MKKRKLVVVFVIMELVLITMSFTISSQGFKNGKFTRNVFADGIDVKDPNDRDKFYEKCYGTHDWLAEAALDAILADQSTAAKWKGNDNKEFWTEERKILCYIGTEAPDVSTTTHIITLNGKALYGLNSPQISHSVYFFSENETDTNLRMKPSFKQGAQNAKEYSELAKKALKKSKCDLAAYYIGVTLHFIVDLASFPHVMRYEDIPKPRPTPKEWSKLHGDFEADIQTVTNDHNDRKIEFTYPEDFDVESIYPRKGEENIGQPSIHELALLVAYKTRWSMEIFFPSEMAKTPTPDYWHSGTYNSIWFYSNYKKGFDTWDTIYKEKMQIRLDYAVICCAKAINVMADSWSKECVCDDQVEKEGAYPINPITMALAWALGVLVLIGVTQSMFKPMAQYIIYRYAEKTKTV